MGEDNSLAISYMHDIGEEIKSSIISTTVQGLHETRRLAHLDELKKAFESNNPASLQQLANQYIKNSGQLDVIALFNKEGEIEVINNVDKSGEAIPKERLLRVMGASFKGREIISGCLINKNKKAMVEFQTHCDFTPALFDSSGLSVAFSVPVTQGSNQSRIGLISTRLNFKRILDVLNRKNRRFREEDLFLVSDQGKYFSEEINSGKKSPPMPEKEIQDLIRPVASSRQGQDILLRRGDYYINIFSLGIQETMENGNLYVLVRCPRSWVESQGRKTAMMLAGIFIALFISFILIIFLIASDISRARATELAQKMAEELLKESDERKKLESRMIQSEKMAAVGQLAGGVAHEINNPLGVILGFAQNISKRINPGDPFELPIKSIEREAIRCKNLVRDLLTFSRVEEGDKLEIELSQTIDAALSLVTAQGKVKDISIEKIVESNLPKILGNSTQIQQIIINLANNAMDAMPEGGKLMIRAKAVQGSGKSEVGIQVEDTGSGIPENIQKKIFEPFFTTKPIGKGTGLGLSLVYEIVRKHHGTIHLESQMGRGTVFNITLPAQST